MGFVIQLEVWHPGMGTWAPVIRYDTAHGFVHRDWVRPDGLVEKTPIPIEDYTQALQYAEADLKDNWQIYRSRFLEGLEDEERKQTG